MKKIDLGQSLQILANAGVIAGIVFLAVELRQNNDQLEAQSRFNYYQNRIAAYRFIAGQDELTELVGRAGNGEALSGAEAARVSNQLLSLITSWEYEFGELQNGRISAGDFNAEAKRQVWLSLPAVQGVWESYAPTAPADFAEFMRSEIIGE